MLNIHDLREDIDFESFLQNKEGLRKTYENYVGGTCYKSIIKPNSKSREYLWDVDCNNYTCHQCRHEIFNFIKENYKLKINNIAIWR